MPDKIMLIDGNSIINRAFYGLPLLTDKDGNYTNAVYGFLNIFFKLLDEEKPTYTAVAFDLPAPTFRHKKYSEYKGTRKSMPEELRPQIPLLKSLLRKMEIPVFEQEGYEADDILGTLAVSCDKMGLLPVIISGDRDMLQLCSKTIKVRIPKTKQGKTVVEDYLEKDIIEKMGVTPTEYIDVKALMGDASDNIPGVPGIGEKTAFKIIIEYKTIENAIENAKDITPKKASENLVEYKDQAVLSKELATIFLEVPLSIKAEDIGLSKIYTEDAWEEIRRMNFKSLYPRFSAVGKNDEKSELAQEKRATTRHKIATEAVKDFLVKLEGATIVAFSMIFDKSENLGVSFCFDEENDYFVSVDSPLEEMGVIKGLQPFFESSTKKIIFDYKKQGGYLEKMGVRLENVVFDAMLGAYIIDSSLGAYSCSQISEDFLKQYRQPAEEVFGKGKAKKAEPSSETILAFGCEEGRIIYDAYPIMEKILKENGQDKLYYDIELPLVSVLRSMEIYGVKIDKGALTQYGKALDEEIHVLISEIYALSGEEFNINSPMQLGVVLFEKLGLKTSKKTKTGYSTSADVLEKLLPDHPVIEKILQYRTYAKLKSTYVDGLLAVIAPDGKIHTTFNQTIASTGRISSVEPNLQNIPIRLELGRKLRKVFIPTNEDFIFIDGDYSQIELRVLAHMSGDETLINAFKNGQDIHKLTASQVLKISYDDVTPKQRSNAKAVNFGIVYGIGSFSLSQDLKISKKEADDYIKGYFEKYPMVKIYMDKTIENARKTGYASTVFGRRRSIPELSSSNFNLRSFGERVAMNMPIQGTAADIIKIAMNNVHKRLSLEGFKSRLILQVHDELLVETHVDEIELVKALLKQEMENCVKLEVPLETDFNEGKTWYDAK